MNAGEVLDIDSPEAQGQQPDTEAILRKIDMLSFQNEPVVGSPEDLIPKDKQTPGIPYGAALLINIHDDNKFGDTAMSDPKSKEDPCPTHPLTW
jgi:hypothetical protein